MYVVYKREIFNIVPWEFQRRVLMEVYHCNGENSNAIVVCIILVLRDSWCVKCWGLSKTGVRYVIVVAKISQSLFQRGGICRKG